MNRQWIELVVLFVLALSACGGGARVVAMPAFEVASTYSDVGTTARRVGAVKPEVWVDAGILMRRDTRSGAAAGTEMQPWRDCGALAGRGGSIVRHGVAGVSTYSDAGTLLRRASLDW